MNGKRLFLILSISFLPFFFSNFSFSKETLNKCTVSFGSYTVSGSHNVNSVVPTSLSIDYVNLTVHEQGSYNFPSTEHDQAWCQIYLVHFDGTQWQLVFQKTYGVSSSHFTPPSFDFPIPPSGFSLTAFRNQYEATCANDSCDKKDDDGDGVCNSCDKHPASFDPQDCVTSRAYDNATRKIIGMTIDEGCDGSNDTYYQSPSSLVGTPYVDMPFTGRYLYKLPPKTCKGTDANGQCGCGYQNGSDTLADNAAPPDNFHTSTAISDINKANPDLAETKSVDDATKVPETTNPDESVKNDPTQDKGTNNDEKNTENIADIEEAIRQLNYQIQKESQSLQNKQLSVIERQDIQNQIAKNIQTLQENQNKLAQATNEKLATTNSKLDLINNNNLKGQDETSVKLDGIAGAIDKGNGKLDGIKDGIGEANGKLDGIAAAIGEGNGKLDGINEKLGDISDKLNEGITPDGTAELPKDNEYKPEFEDEYKEEPFEENVKKFVSNGLPFTHFLEGTKVSNVGSSASLSYDVYGSHISIDFSKYENVYNIMGAVFYFCCVVMAGFIIVGRSK